MSAAAAKEKLEALIRGKNPVRVTEMSETTYSMTASVVRQRFELGKEFQITERGVGVRKWDGNWLWVEEEGERRTSSRLMETGEPEIQSRANSDH